MQYWIFDANDDENELTGLHEITVCAATGQRLGHAVTWHWTHMGGHDVRFGTNSEAAYNRDELKERIWAHAIEHGYIRPDEHLSNLDRYHDGADVAELE